MHDLIGVNNRNPQCSCVIVHVLASSINKG